MREYDNDVVKLLTQLVRELRAENEMLKGDLMKRSIRSSLADQISAVESGRVVER